MKQARGIRNNNPLNIRKGSNWKGERPIQTDKAFEEFTSMEYGIRAGFKLMCNHINGFGGKRPKANTIAKLIRVWAPPVENKTNKYIDFVAEHAGIGATDLIDVRNVELMVRIARAMAYYECGEWLDKSLFYSAWLLK